MQVPAWHTAGDTEQLHTVTENWFLLPADKEARYTFISFYNITWNPNYNLMPPQQTHHTFNSCANVSPQHFFFNVAEFVIKGVHYSASEVLQHDHRAQLYRCFLQDFLRCKQNQDNWPDRLRRSSHRPTAGTENLLWALINGNKQKTT